MSKKFQPTPEQRRQAETLAGLGLPHKHIARILGCSEPTLRKYLSDELASGDAKATAKVAQNLFQIATSGKSKEAVTAGIFWMKVRAGWSEKLKIEESGPDGGPISKELVVRFVKPGDGVSD
jgi:predicted transcriptional regulator